MNGNDQTIYIESTLNVWLFVRVSRNICLNYYTHHKLQLTCPNIAVVLSCSWSWSSILIFFPSGWHLSHVELRRLRVSLYTKNSNKRKWPNIIYIESTLNMWLIAHFFLAVIAKVTRKKMAYCMRGIYVFTTGCRSMFLPGLLALVSGASLPWCLNKRTMYFIRTACWLRAFKDVWNTCSIPDEQTLSLS
jgi:hypothetical protein